MNSLEDFSDKYAVLETPKKEYEVLVLLATYQSEKTVKEALQSIEHQTFHGTLALLIHDDASTDNTRQVISDYASSSQLEVFRAFRKTNSFDNSERYLMWQLVQTFDFKYLAICDGDDVWLSKNKLSEQVAVLEKWKRVAIVYHGHEQGFASHSKENVDHYERLDKSPAWLQRLYCSARLPTIHSSTMYRKEFLDISNILLVDKFPAADFVLLWSSLQHGSARYIPGIRFFYRLGGSFNTLPKDARVAIRDGLVNELKQKLKRRTVLRLLMTEKIKDLMGR